MSSQWLTIAEAAALLGVAPVSVLRLAYGGVLPRARVGQRRLGASTVRVRRAEVLARRAATLRAPMWLPGAEGYRERRAAQMRRLRAVWKAAK